MIGWTRHTPKVEQLSVFFCVSVLHAMKMNMHLQKHGIESRLLTGETPGEEKNKY